jgi:hypothetical protein
MSGLSEFLRRRLPLVLTVSSRPDAGQKSGGFAQKKPLPRRNSGLGFFLQQKQATVDRLKFASKIISVLMNWRLCSS